MIRTAVLLLAVIIIFNLLTRDRRNRALVFLTTLRWRSLRELLILVLNYDGVALVALTGIVLPLMDRGQLWTICFAMAALLALVGVRNSQIILCLVGLLCVRSLVDYLQTYGSWQSERHFQRVTTASMLFCICAFLDQNTGPRGSRSMRPKRARSRPKEIPDSEPNPPTSLKECVEMP